MVVDNESADGTAELVEREWPDAIVVRAGANLGFARGCNLGVASFDAAHVLFLNPDTRMAPGCVEALLDLARRRPDAGLYGGHAVSPDGTFDPRSCFGRPTIWSLICFATGLSSMFPENAWLNTEGIGGWPRDHANAPSAWSAAASCSRRVRCGSASVASTRSSSCTARTPSSASVRLRSAITR